MHLEVDQAVGGVAGYEAMEALFLSILQSMVSALRRLGHGVLRRSKFIRLPYRESSLHPQRNVSRQLSSPNSLSYSTRSGRYS